MADQDDVDFTTLPLEQRASHKVWKARLNAYQELNNLFTQSSVISPPNDVANYWLDPELFASYIVDSNVVAQENAIIALHTLLEYISQVPNVSTSKLRLQWIPPLVEKGLSSSRAATKAKATDCIMLLTQSDTSIQQTVNLMLPSLSNKLPRLVSSCVKCLATIIEEFGFINVSDVNILLSEILEPLPKLSSHADRNVRSETMNLILQIYKWFGKELLQELLLEKLKPIQQRDLGKMFEKYEGTIPPKQQPRLFQWQKEQEQEQEQILQTDKDGDTLMGNLLAYQDTNASAIHSATKPAIDPFELLPPSVILDKFPADFQTRISSTKWKDRVEALEEIHNNVLEPVKKLAYKNQDYSDYLRVLANVIQKDANVQAVTIAANSVQLLCNSLRSNFTRSYGAIVLVPLLERTREKKPSVNEAICSALDAVETYCGFDDCLEETLNYMKHKTPQVRIECTKFLTRMLQGWKSDGPLQNQLLFKLLPEVTTAVLKIVNDTQPTTRNTGFECFATLMKLVGERELADPLEKLDNLKKKKIYEYYEKVEVATGVGASVSTIKFVPETKTQVASTRNPISNGTIPTSSSLSVPSLRDPGSSTIPSKRGATSPLRMERNGTSIKNNVPSVKSRLTTRSLTTPNDTPLNAHELEELKLQKQKWLKERQELLAKMVTFQNQTSQLNNENAMLQQQVNRLQTSLHEKATELRSKEIQLSKAHDRISTLEQELETKNSTPHSSLDTKPGPSFDTDLAPGTPPLQRPSPSELSSLSANDRYKLPGFGGNKYRDNTNSNNNGISGRFSPLRSGRVRTPSESSDDLPYRVNSLKLNSAEKHSSNAISGSAFANDESWKRAAEVTSQLKARIERMRAKTRGMNND